MSDAHVVVTGAGGFIGGHLTGRLMREGYGRIRAVDVRPLDEWYQAHPEVESVQLDLSSPDACRQAVRGADVVYNLAADMGGMGFIESNKARCMLSVLINTNLLLASRESGVTRYFFASSACVYRADRQDSPDVMPLKESDAYPALPEDGYGWEKLFSERMCRHFTEDFDFPTRVARYHNVYGPHGTYRGGREKAPAAICRKVAEAVLSGRDEIRIWGDGSQTRSFMCITDCLDGTRRLMESDVSEPLNLGSSELVSIDDLVSIVEGIADVRLRRVYEPDAPTGVRGRNSENSLIQARLGWEPSISLRGGLSDTYQWVFEQVARDRAEGRTGATAGMQSA